MAKQPKAIFGNHPFTPDGKKNEPIFLDSSNIGYFVYPDEGLDYSDLNNVFFSGEHLTVCTMDIGPGGFFNPPDYHPGDEAYFITEGVDSQYCPATGQMIQVGKDEALLIPKGVLHSAYNFEIERLRVIAVIAPKIVEDQTFPTDTDTPKKLLQGAHNAELPCIGEYDDPQLIGSVDNLGAWPAPGPVLREKGVLYHVTEQKKLQDRAWRPAPHSGEVQHQQRFYADGRIHRARRRHHLPPQRRDRTSQRMRAGGAGRHYHGLPARNARRLPNPPLRRAVSAAQYPLPADQL